MTKSKESQSGVLNKTNYCLNNGGPPHSSIKNKGKIPPMSNCRPSGKIGGLMFLAGIATGLCGFGGGIYYMPIFNALGYPMHIAIGTSSTQMIPEATIGATNLTIYSFQNWFYVLTIGL